MAVRSILRGDHWSEVLWKGYEHFGIGVNADEEVEPGVSIGKSSFRDAYVYGERVLAVHPLVKAEDHFEDILRMKIHFQLSFLASAPLLETGKDDALKQQALAERLELSESEIAEISSSMAAYINSETQQLLAENKQVLEHLKQAGYPMVLVSNFYGNINQVLEGCGHRWLFQSRHRVGGSGCSQAKSCYLRPRCLCFGFAGFAGAGGGRYASARIFFQPVSWVAIHCGSRDCNGKRRNMTRVCLTGF